MKKLLRYLLLGQSAFNEYKTVSLRDEDIIEQAVLRIGGQELDVSRQQWLLSLEPMIFGIWLNEAQRQEKLPAMGRLDILVQHKTVASATLRILNQWDEAQGRMLLFEVQQTDLFHLSQFRIRWIHRLYYKKERFEQFKNLVLAFSFPRKVRVISYQEAGYLNLFPMDLVGELTAEKRFFFGLRHSNITLQKIISSQRMVASEFPSTYKQQIYQLSRHHSQNPPDAEALDFEISTTEKFGFSIPEWATRYHEISLQRTLDLGSHMLLCGETVNKVALSEKTESLCHIHFIHYLYHQRNKFRYREV